MKKKYIKDSSLNIGNIIKTGRKNKKLSQTELANLIGNITAASVSSWEKNRTIPPGNKLIELALSLDIVPQLFPNFPLDYLKNTNTVPEVVLSILERLSQIISKLEGINKLDLISAVTESAIQKENSQEEQKCLTIFANMLLKLLY